MAEEKTQLDQIQESIELLARHLEPLPEQVDRLGKGLKTFRRETEANFAEVQTASPRRTLGSVDSSGASTDAKSW